MPRNMVQDVLPPERKSVRDIPIPEERRRKPAPRAYEEAVTHTFQEKNISDISLPRKKHPKLALWLSIIVALLILSFAFSTVFGNATVFVTPKKQSVAADLTLKAQKEGEESALLYDVITFSKTGSKIIPATEEKNVDTKAQGKIVIYNNESAPQALIKNTRFESPQGLIYRINEGVTVPAKSGTIPGSKEVTVYADVSGEKYNIGLVDFTIPGFKGDPKFKTVYARSKTPMEGGASGLTKTASAKDIEQARKDIEANLRGEILTEAKGQTPQNFILFDDAVFIEFEKEQVKPANLTSVEVTVRASFHGIIFNKENITSHLAKQTIKTEDKSGIEIPNIQALAFSALGEGPIWEKEEITFKLTGNVEAVWKYDEAELKKAVAGKNLDEIKPILLQNPSLQKTEIVIKPFWKKTLPESPEKINVVKKDL